MLDTPSEGLYSSKLVQVTINPHLVKASRECVDYMLLHELCHLAEHNHSDRFYRLMNQVIPKWAEIKALLDNNANRYINNYTDALTKGISTLNIGLIFHGPMPNYMSLAKASLRPPPK